MAKLETEGAVNSRAQMESELARFQRALAAMNKKSNFSTDFSAKNRFSGGMKTILTKKKSEEKKSAKNWEKLPIFRRKIGKI